MFRGQLRLERAENCQRPAPQVVAIFLRNREQARNDLDRNARGEVFDQIHLAAAGEALREFVEQLRHHAFEHHDGRLDRLRLQRFRQRRAHARVIRRIVEDEARRVMAEQRAGAELGSEQATFVGAEVRVAVYLQTIVVAGYEIRTVGATMDRVGFAKRRVPRKRIVDESGGRMREIEVCDRRRVGRTMRYSGTSQSQTARPSGASARPRNVVSDSISATA